MIAPAPDADLLVLAGDVSRGTRAIELFAAWPVPVLYIAGNHEFYSHQWEALRAELRAAAEGTSVVFLDNDVADLSRFTHWLRPRAQELARIRFLGSTLWTDYRHHGLRTQCELMERAEELLADHSRIRVGDGLFRAEHALTDHMQSRAWLEQELAKPFEGYTVVVTHHGPHPKSIHPRFLNPADMPANAAFISDLGELLPKADLWLHGHVHDSFDYVEGRCRVVANPRGYTANRRTAATAADLVFENAAFNCACVLEVGGARSRLRQLPRSGERKR